MWITDRTNADVNRAKELIAKGYSNLTTSEKAEWDNGLKGTINYTDMNRYRNAVIDLFQSVYINASETDILNYTSIKDAFVLGELFVREKLSTIDNMLYRIEGYFKGLTTELPYIDITFIPTIFYFNDLEKYFKECYDCINGFEVSYTTTSSPSNFNTTESKKYCIETTERPFRPILLTLNSSKIKVMKSNTSGVINANYVLDISRCANSIDTSSLVNCNSVSYYGWSSDTTANKKLVSIVLSEKWDYVFTTGLFKDCTLLTTLTIDGGFQSGISVEQDAFNGCSSFANKTIIENAGYIGKNSFKNCVSINGSISINASSVGENAFYGCSGITSAVISTSVLYLNKKVFENCSNLTEITFSGTKSQWNTLITASSSDWNSGSSITVIHCSDGDIQI